MKIGYLHGYKAERIAAAYLESCGYKIRDLNWKTRICEIDIVAENNNTIFFVEVKYRQKTTWGRGLEYITFSKKRKMALAAELWTMTTKWTGPYQLAALELGGDPPRVTSFLEEL